jgi:hypothetical protein
LPPSYTLNTGPRRICHPRRKKVLGDARPTYIKNSDWYRTYFYGDAKDGWYGGTGGTLHAGAKGGATLGRVEVVLRAGVTKSEALNDLDLPFYATLGANLRF